jgi:hypothetical protein
MVDNDLKEARARADVLRQSLPLSVDAAALGVWSKAPFQLLCTREALIWRTDELARTACDALPSRTVPVARGSYILCRPADVSPCGIL